MLVRVQEARLDPANPGRILFGRLRLLGGIEISSNHKEFGGFSSLEWRNGQLYSVTDAGDWASFRTIERDRRLKSVKPTGFGDLLGMDGQLLEGTATGDAESLVYDGRGWLVGFEHDHKILRYGRLGDVAEESGLDPERIFGPLEANNGVEALASDGKRTFLCAERLPSESAPNCIIRSRKGVEPVSVPPPLGLDPKTAFPVDADWGADGTLYILMRSWSQGDYNRAAIVARSSFGHYRTLAAFLRPLADENYEGLAVREEAGRTFFYVISDDNFHVYDNPDRPQERSRTLLWKFELIG